MPTSENNYIIVMPTKQDSPERESCSKDKDLDEPGYCFLDLPAELQIKIYEYMSPAISGFRASHYTSLCLSCQQFRKEMDVECKMSFIKALDHLQTVLQAHYTVFWPEMTISGAVANEQPSHPFPCLDKLEIHLGMDISISMSQEGLFESFSSLLHWSTKTLTLRFLVEPFPESKEISANGFVTWFCDLSLLVETEISSYVQLTRSIILGTHDVCASRNPGNDLIPMLIFRAWELGRRNPT
jgi:hypothetical protein